MSNYSLIIILYAVVIPTDALLGIIGSKQGVTVTGRLICNGQPANGVLVKMYEDGTSKFNCGVNTLKLPGVTI